MIIQSPSPGPIFERISLIEKYEYVRHEGITVAAGATFTLHSTSGAGQHIYTWLSVDGASGAGSWSSLLRFFVDDLLIEDRVIRFLGGAGGTASGIPECYCIYLDSAAFWITGFHAVKYFFKRNFRMEFKNQDTVSATVISACIVVEKYTQINSI